jgi:hypothetical protein
MFDFFLYHHPISNSFGALDFIYTAIIENSSKLVSISAAAVQARNVKYLNSPN